MRRPTDRKVFRQTEMEVLKVNWCLSAVLCTELWVRDDRRERQDIWGGEGGGDGGRGWQAGDDKLWVNSSRQISSYRWWMTTTAHPLALFLPLSLFDSDLPASLRSSVHYRAPLWVNTVRKQRQQVKDRKWEVSGEKWLERGMMGEEQRA